MAKRDKASQVAIGVSAAAAIAAALAFAQKAKAATPEIPEGVVQLPQELWNLIIAIANALDSVDTDLDTVITELSKLSISVQGWPPNTEGITSLRVAIATTGTILPYIAVPSGMALVIKAWALNPGWLQVGGSLAECSNINQSFSLLPNETAGYFVQNAEQVYIAATVAGCFACLTVEQRKGGQG